MSTETAPLQAVHVDAVVRPLMRPMHKRPAAGLKINVHMRDGRILEKCTTCMVWNGDSSGIVIYHRRRAIDESKAKGWWPAVQALRRHQR